MRASFGRRAIIEQASAGHEGCHEGIRRTQIRSVAGLPRCIRAELWPPTETAKVSSYSRP